MGNERVSDETVIMFSTLKTGDEINKENLNNALKNLYYTDYFKSVTISFNEDQVKIVVSENPIIQSIIIEV